MATGAAQVPRDVEARGAGRWTLAEVDEADLRRDTPNAAILRPNLAPWTKGRRFTYVRSLEKT